MKVLLLVVTLGLLTAVAAAQPINPANPPIQCEWAPARGEQ